MFDNVVVGIDDYEPGRDALALARELVSGDGRVLLVYVQVVMVAPPGVDSDPVWQADDRRLALKRLASLRDEARVDAELLTVQAGSVAAGLHGAVRRHGDLVVIGASRRDDYERVFVGDDAREVLEDSPSPVAVAPVGYAMRPSGFKKIGVAYDGSSGSEQALTAARKLAHECHAELSAFEAVAEPIYVHDPWNAELEVERPVTRARRRLAELGDVEPHAASGDTPAELALYASTVDLLVLGPHKHRARDWFMAGSTSQRLADSAPCPLLVLSPAAGRAAGA